MNESSEAITVLMPAVPCVVLFDGTTVRMLPDSGSTVDTAVIRPIERALHIARLRAWADLLEKDGRDDG